MSDPTLSEQIEEFAMLQFTDEEIATIVEMGIDDLITDHRKDIDRGRLRAEADIRASMLKLAKEGNATAMKTFLQFNKQAKLATARRK